MGVLGVLGVLVVLGVLGVLGVWRVLGVLGSLGEALGARRADKLYAVQQKDAKGWRTHWTEDAFGSKIQLFFDKDKSRFSFAGELWTKVFKL